MIKIINLTPHAVNLKPVNGGEVVVEPSGTMARCSSERKIIGEIEVAEGVKIPLTQVVLGEVSGLPAPEEGTIYIVSLHVANRVARGGRTMDILVPDESIRDADGKIVGCRALARQD